MNANEDFEKAARRLDGGQEPLTPDQQRLAEEIAADARQVAPALDVEMPPGVLMRVHARMTSARRAQTMRRRRRAARWAAGVGVAAAVAGAVLVAAMLLQQPGSHHLVPPGRMSPDDYVRNFLGTPDDLQTRAQMLSAEMADCQMELTLADVWGVDVALSGLDQELNELLLDEYDNSPTWAD